MVKKGDTLSAISLIGRTDLLEILQGETAKQHNLDLTPLLGSDHIPADKPQFCQVERNPPFDKGLLAEKMVDMATSAINDLSGADFALDICNCDRSIGARISGEIARAHGNQGMAKAPITFRFKGTAGQSFGVWNAGTVIGAPGTVIGAPGTILRGAGAGSGSLRLSFAFSAAACSAR